ncbi:CAP domain-containing protein [Corynebacterium guangdongense]|uniref:Uncharacterized protein YkwD n=1 Tax=Corynebacterium guangdongense TaxID=1783348 RepID=A0ABU1ZZ03_9CORY|nr:CAP domain-containing protein [Corynebacterium guangdongense]MDR7330173.1 uncharacterized protein YkwD [Corynebacterium guangdongense]WJZ18731.1 hypothetical protein CGUA_10920 [Corynebacterium guangdongense]
MNEMSSRLAVLGSELINDPLNLVREPNRVFATLLSAATLAASTVLGVTAGEGGAGYFGGSSGDYGDFADFEDPALQEQQRLTAIEQDLQRGLLELRAREAVDYLSGSGPLLPDPALQLQAQDAARDNAANGREQAFLDSNVSMIQASLPAESASGEAFLDLWLRSAPHTEIILDPAYAFYGVSTAQGHGKVWAVILFSR